MRHFLAKLLLASVALTLFPLGASNGAEASDPVICRIDQVDQSQILRIGWPKYPGLIAPLGSPKFLVVGVDFLDVEMKEFPARGLDTVLQLNKVSESYRFVSSGKFVPSFDVFPSWVRMPSPSSFYGTSVDQVEFTREDWGTHHLTHDLVQALSGNVNFERYQGIITVVSGGQALSGRAAFSTLFDAGVKQESNFFSHHIVLGLGWRLEEQFEIWHVIVHEFNHLLGLPDLYLYSADGFWQGKTPGPFGHQAYIFDLASDSLAWNRWLNSWIPDEQVLCLGKFSDLKEIAMNPPHSRDSGGREMVVLRISESKVLVIEALDENGYSAKTYPNALLVYTVDSSIKTGEGPVRLVARETAITTSELMPSLPDWRRFREAPLIPGSSVRYKNLLIVNESKLGDGAVLSIYTTDNRSEQALTEILEELKKNQPSASTTDSGSVVKKTITCKKGKVIRKVTAVKPKCPSGFTKVKVAAKP